MRRLLFTLAFAVTQIGHPLLAGAFETHPVAAISSFNAQAFASATVFSNKKFSSRNPDIKHAVPRVRMAPLLVWAGTLVFAVMSGLAQTPALQPENNPATVAIQKTIDLMRAARWRQNTITPIPVADMDTLLRVYTGLPSPLSLQLIWESNPAGRFFAEDTFSALTHDLDNLASRSMAVKILSVVGSPMVGMPRAPNDQGEPVPRLVGRLLADSAASGVMGLADRAQEDAQLLNVWIYRPGGKEGLRQAIENGALQTKVEALKWVTQLSETDQKAILDPITIDKWRVLAAQPDLLEPSTLALISAHVSEEDARSVMADHAQAEKSSAMIERVLPRLAAGDGSVLSPLSSAELNLLSNILQGKNTAQLLPLLRSTSDRELLRLLMMLGGISNGVNVLEMDFASERRIIEALSDRAFNAPAATWLLRKVPSSWPLRLAYINTALKLPDSFQMPSDIPDWILKAEVLVFEEVVGRPAANDQTNMMRFEPLVPEFIRNLRKSVTPYSPRSDTAVLNEKRNDEPPSPGRSTENVSLREALLGPIDLPEIDALLEGRDPLLARLAAEDLANDNANLNDFVYQHPDSLSSLVDELRGQAAPAYEELLLNTMQDKRDRGAILENLLIKRFSLTEFLVYGTIQDLTDLSTQAVDPRARSAAQELLSSRPRAALDHSTPPYGLRVGA